MPLRPFKERKRQEKRIVRSLKSGSPFSDFEEAASRRTSSARALASENASHAHERAAQGACSALAAFWIGRAAAAAMAVAATPEARGVEGSFRCKHMRRVFSAFGALVAFGTSWFC